MFFLFLVSFTFADPPVPSPHDVNGFFSKITTRAPDLTNAIDVLESQRVPLAACATQHNFTATGTIVFDPLNGEVECVHVLYETEVGTPELPTGPRECVQDIFTNTHFAPSQVKNDGPTIVQFRYEHIALEEEPPPVLPRSRFTIGNRNDRLF